MSKQETSIYYVDISILKEKDIFESIYNQLDNFEKQKADKIVDINSKYLCCVSSLLKKFAIKKYLGENIEIKFIYNEFGKPYLINNDCYFNVSHSGKYVVCAVNDTEIGCDVEKIKEEDLNIAKRFFTSLEYQNIVNSNNPTNYFYKYWTLKESFVKNVGKGLSIPLNSFEITFDKNILINQNIVSDNFYFKEFMLDKDYQFALSTRRIIETINIISVSVDELIKR